MASELKKTILEVADLQERIVDVPEWGVKVLVRGMSAGDRAKLLESSTPAGGGKLDMANWFANLVIASAFDPDTGEKIFEVADRDSLKTKNGKAIARITDVATALSGLTDTAVEDAKSGFDDAQNDGSLSS